MTTKQKFSILWLSILSVLFWGILVSLMLMTNFLIFVSVLSIVLLLFYITVDSMKTVLDMVLEKQRKKAIEEIDRENLIELIEV